MNKIDGDFLHLRGRSGPFPIITKSGKWIVYEYMAHASAYKYWIWHDHGVNPGGSHFGGKEQRCAHCKEIIPDNILVTIRILNNL